MFAKERRSGGCHGQSESIKTLTEDGENTDINDHKQRFKHILYLYFSHSFYLISPSRRIRRPFTLRLAWVRQRSCSCYCSTWLTLMLPPLMDTHLCTSPLVKGRWTRLRCCWRPERLTRSPRRCDCRHICETNTDPHSNIFSNGSSLTLLFYI